MLEKDETRSRRRPLAFAIAAILALAGLADSIYLTIEHLTGRSVQCAVSSSCSEVLASPYATLGRVPLASLGAVAYFSTFSFATLAAFGYARARPLLTFTIAAMSIVTLGLLFIQAFVLRAFCDYCLLSAAITGSLLLVVTASWFVRTG